jgi:hypothetical protein
VFCANREGTWEVEFFNMRARGTMLLLPHQGVVNQAAVQQLTGAHRNVFGTYLAAVDSITTLRRVGSVTCLREETDGQPPTVGDAPAFSCEKHHFIISGHRLQPVACTRISNYVQEADSSIYGLVTCSPCFSTCHRTINML